MKLTNLLFLFFFTGAIALTGCSDAGDYQSMAEEVCNCMSEMAELEKQYRTNEGAGNIGESFAVSAEMETATREAEECMTRIEEENEVDDIESDIALMDAIRAECPESAAMLDNYEE